MFWKKRNDRMRETDPHFVKFCELSDTNDSLYTKEAGQILETKYLTKIIGNFRIEYSIVNNIAGYKMFDQTSGDQLVEAMEAPIPDNKKKLVADLKEYLAHSEATALIDSK